MSKDNHTMRVLFDGKNLIVEDTIKHSGEHFGVLVPIPDGYEAVTRKPELLDDIIKSQSMLVLDGLAWVQAVDYYSTRCYCIDVKRLKGWYKAQIVKSKTELEYYTNSLRAIENE